MRYEIRAMSFGEILDTSFRILRDHFVLLTGIGLAAFLPAVAIGFAVGFFMTPGTEPSASMVAGILLAVAIFVVLLPATQIAMVHGVGEVYLGRASSIREALGVGFSMLTGAVGTTLLMSLAVMGGILLLIVPGVYLALTFLLVMPVMALERRFGPSALRRSRELLHGSLLRVVGILFLVGILQSVLGFTAQLVLGLVPYVGWIGEVVVQATTSAFSSVALTVLYFDIRARREAFDLEHLARLVEGDVGAAAAPAV